MVRTCGEVVLLLLSVVAVLPAQFGYDTEQPFDATCEELSPRTEAELNGCGFSGPRGGRVHFIRVTPKTTKPPFAGVIFQHGGGQSMSNYLSEAFILARAGVVSMIVDAPARGEGKVSDLNALKLEEARDFQAEIVITERRILDYLLQQPGVDPKRIAYVGHSYGGIAGGVLAGVEPRILAFVLVGALPSTAVFIRESKHPYWQKMRYSMPEDEFEETLAMIRQTDPVHFLPKAKASVLVQCARFDTADNIQGCPEVHAIAGGPKQLIWYDDDHNFTSLEALRDRLAWLEKHLKLPPLGKHIAHFLER